MKIVVRHSTFLLLFLAMAATAGQVCADTYRVDNDSSSVVIHVSRAGIARALGHDHLISTRQLSGSATYVTNDLHRSRFSLRLPVRTLVADDPLLRKQAGGKYAKAVSESARKSTRRNMLGERVLDAASFGTIDLQGRWHSGTLSNGWLAATISLHGVRREMNVPVHIQTESGKLIATGKFQVRQSDYAIKPFTAVAGALAVADTVEIEYRVVLAPDQLPGAIKE